MHPFEKMNQGRADIDDNTRGIMAAQILAADVPMVKEASMQCNRQECAELWRKTVGAAVELTDDLIRELNRASARPNP